jgi:hypothetical protein
LWKAEKWNKSHIYIILKVPQNFCSVRPFLL